MDVGANHGTHTVALAKMVGVEGKVYAFEPQRLLFQIICANLALNGLTNVEAHCAGLGDTVGMLNVPLVDYSRNNNFGAVEMGGRGGNSVPLLTIDSLKLDRLDFAKIDAEGMEGAIVDGALETIKRCRPLLYMENDRDDKSPQLIQKMWDLDYTVYFHLPYYFNQYNFRGDHENIYGGTISVNILCIPKEDKMQVPEGCHLATSVTNTWRSFG
jgi:FkbM family methyltransferase